MITLMIKDVRQSLWPLLLAVVVLVGPAVVWVVSLMTDQHGAMYHDVWRELARVALFGAVASLIASSGVAGVAFAKERRERTADLMATLPVHRGKVVASKIAAALVVALAPCLVGVVACLLCSAASQQTPWASSLDVVPSVRLVVAAWLLLFGLAWALSAALKSEVVSAAAPILVLLAVVLGAMNWGVPPYGSMPNAEIEKLVMARMTWACGVIGAVGLVTGVAVALRRKSP